MRRGTGHKSDAGDPRDYIAAERFGLAAVVPPDEATLEHHVGEVYDQGQTNSCVGWAFSNAIEIAESVAGLDPVQPSALMIYTLARWATVPNAPFVLDVGCRPRDACKALTRIGVCDEEHWPFSRLPWRKNRRPSMNAIIQAHGRRGGEYARIGGYGKDRVAGIKQAIAAGYPVPLAFRITDKWFDFTGPDTLEMPDLTYPIAGGHMVCAVGYEPGRIRILNSWSDAWRDNGLAWVTEEYVGSGYCSDATVVRGWERIRKAYEARKAADA